MYVSGPTTPLRFVKDPRETFHLLLTRIDLRLGRVPTPTVPIYFCPRRGVDVLSGMKGERLGQNSQV